MSVVSYVIRDNGDGSQQVEWYLDVTRKELVTVCSNCEDERYQSGDGIQATELHFPEGFDPKLIRGVSWSTLDELKDNLSDT
jgi:hypothetical protein